MKDELVRILFTNLIAWIGSTKAPPFTNIFHGSCQDIIDEAKAKPSGNFRVCSTLLESKYLQRDTSTKKEVFCRSVFTEQHLPAIFR
jgi:hypothetical protein